MNQETQILPTDTPAAFAAAVEQAATLLRRGELVAVPTETVYGLAANAWEAAAVEKIFPVKARPGHNPIIVHVADLGMARQCVASWPPAADRLAAAFWPGSLTLVLPRSERIPAVVTAGGGTVGVRWPNHPFIQALIRECGFPLAAPSANVSSRLSPTTATHVRRSLEGKIPLIVDGGSSQVGIESTVLDLSVKPPRVLRPGMIHAESLLAALPESGLQTGEFGRSGVPGTLRSPGLLRKHYAPKARLAVWSWADESELNRRVLAEHADPSQVHVVAHTRIPSGVGLGRVRILPRDAAAFARAIYAELHRCDEEEARLIVVEAVPDTVEWQAIADRLRRACSPG